MSNPEFSRILNVPRLSPNGAVEKLQAKPDERAALAKRFDLLDLHALTAELDVQPASQQSVRVTGKMHAEVTQHCVVTLEPIKNKIDIKIDVTFIPDDLYGDETELPADDLDEEIEIYSNGKIDLGELIAQQMGINLDPYPRKPNVSLPIAEFGAAQEKPRPFAKLAEVVKMSKNKDKTSD